MNAILSNMGIYDERFFALIVLAVFGMIAVGLGTYRAGVDEEGNPTGNSFPVTFLMLAFIVAVVCVMFKQ